MIGISRKPLVPVREMMPFAPPTAWRLDTCLAPALLNRTPLCGFCLPSKRYSTIISPFMTSQWPGKEQM